MKQAKVKLPSGAYLIQEVPEDADYFDILEQTKIYRKSVNKLSDSETGNWQLLGADPTSLTEEEAGEIVEPLFTKEEIHEPRYHHELNLDPMPYKNYLWNTELDDGSCYSSFDTATASLSSLAQSLGIEKPYVILKNVEK